MAIKVTASTRDSVVIEQVVYLASKARAATGQQPIADIPKGRGTATFCPLARALNLHCVVMGSQISFQTAGHAQLIGEALGLTVDGTKVMVPTGHPFEVFVKRFDTEASKEFRRLRIEG